MLIWNLVLTKFKIFHNECLTEEDNLTLEEEQTLERLQKHFWIFVNTQINTFFQTFLYLSKNKHIKSLKEIRSFVSIASDMRGRVCAHDHIDAMGVSD